jgi:hypothetical protein
MVGSDEVANRRLQLREAAVDTPRRSRPLVSSGNQRSTRFSHDPYVGVKWT